jgi:ABC-type nitrate/sulfonate/bicarbonate transport system substrate-binding protein
MKKALCIVIAALMAATVFTGCSSKKPGTKELSVLRVGVISQGVLSVATNYMIETGNDVANGFRINEEVFQSGVPMNVAIGANSIDVGTTGFAAVTGVATYNEKAIAEIGESNTCALYVRTSSPIAKVKGYNSQYPDVLGDPSTVKGMQIICGVGSLTQFVAEEWLQKIGLKDTDVKLVNMDTATGLQAFEAGQGDVLALNSTMMYYGVENGYVQAADYKTMKIKNYDLLVANPKSYDADKDTITKYVKELYQMNDILRANPSLFIKECENWDTKNGINLTAAAKKALEWEIPIDPILTSAEAKQNIGQMGDTLKSLAQFSVTAGTLQSSKLPLFDQNITTDILKSALGIK